MTVTPTPFPFVDFSNAIYNGLIPGMFTGFKIMINAIPLWVWIIIIGVIVLKWYLRRIERRDRKTKRRKYHSGKYRG